MRWPACIVLAHTQHTYTNLDMAPIDAGTPAERLILPKPRKAILR